MTIREYLKSLGATDAELKAKVVERMEQAMLFDTDITSLTPNALIDYINNATDKMLLAAHTLNGAENTISNININARPIENRLKTLVQQAEEKRKELQEGIVTAEKSTITNTDLKDAVLAYAEVLKATKAVFGEAAMTDTTITSAIEAGSDIAWRGIMGPKYTVTDAPKRRF